MPRAITEDQVTRIREMYVGGKTVNEIAAELKISPASVRKWVSPVDPPEKKRVGRKSLKQPLFELVSAIGVGVSIFNNFDGQCILQGAEKLAESLDEVASQNPNVHKALVTVISGSAWGNVAIASSAILLPIAANHNLIPKIPSLDITKAMFSTEEEEDGVVIVTDRWDSPNGHDETKIVDLADMLKADD